jgi:hypothetical protein
MGKNRRGRRGKGGNEIRYPFKFTYQPLAADSNGFSGTYLDLSCADLGTRISVVCKQFRKWRFCRSLKVKQYMDTTAIAAILYDVATAEVNIMSLSHAVGFYGGPESSLSAVPSNMNTIVELMCSDIGPSGKMLRMTVPLKFLKEAMIAPWHFTTDGGTLPFADSTIIGNLQFGVSMNYTPNDGTANVYVVISGEIEFAEPIEPAISMNSWRPKLSPVFNMPCPIPLPRSKKDGNQNCLVDSTVGDESKAFEVAVHVAYESLVHGAIAVDDVKTKVFFGSTVEKSECSESASELVMVHDETLGRVTPVQTAMSFLPDKIVADTGRSGDGRGIFHDPP